MRELELIENKELRETVVERIEVLEQVKEILTLCNTDFSTVELAAGFYEVNLSTMKMLIKNNKEELLLDGLKVYKQKEVKEILGSIENTEKSNELTFKIPARGLTLIPKRALLRIGMLLRDSEVAKEVRTRLLDIVHDAETKTDIVENVIEEIRTEQQIGEEMTKAIMEGDSNKLMLLQTELIGIKNKRIEKIEGVITNSVTINESKAVINKCVKTMAVQKYSGMFGSTWNEFYKFVNYKLGINANGRKGSGLARFSNDEILEMETIAKCWTEENGIEVELKLN
ncbi:MAG: hypothetical protein ACRC18_06855 [Cetobacterium sp.]